MRARNWCATKLLVTALLVIVSLVVLAEAQRATTARTSRHPQEETWSDQHDERLLAGLNESLSKFLQTSSTGDTAAAVALTIDNDDEHQQQIVALKKISCSRINLVVMAQRALNASANMAALRKLAKCRQENLLDLELVEALEKSTTTTVATGTTSTQVQPRQELRLAEANNHRLGDDRQRSGSDSSSNQTRHQVSVAKQKQQPRDRPFVRQQHELQDECAPSQACTSSGNQPAKPQRAVQELPATGLHLGAKLTIILVVLVMSLVCVATFFDCRQVLGSEKLGSSLTSSYARTTSPYDRGVQNRKGCCESNAGRFFLDLGPQAAKMRDYRSLSISSNSSSNLFCSSYSVASSSAPILPAGQQQAPQQSHKQLQQQQRGTSAATAAGHSCGLYESNLQLHAGQSNLNNGSDPPSSSHEQTVSTARNPGLAWQIVLAFSLRHTAGQIFERQHQQPQQGEGEEANQQNQVDWLHGLRFFSMIWVIVIHSYNFALRWMFFSNTSTLDGIYKSTASQFIANGSFACDSFFFVGGFLLPYLALRPVTEATPKGTVAESDLQESDLEHEVEHGEDEQDARQQVVATANDSAASACCCCYCCAPCCCSWYLSANLCRKQRATCARQQARLPLGSCMLKQCSSSSETASASATCLGANCICFGGGGPITPLPDGEQENSTNQSCAQSKQRHLAENTNERAHAKDHVPQVCHFHHSSASPPPPPPPPPPLSQPSVFTAEDLNPGVNKRPDRINGCAEAQQKRGYDTEQEASMFTWQRCLANVLRRYVRMTPLMMAIIGLCANLLRYLGEGPVWQESTMMYDDWCRRNWWVNALFLHNFVNRENMCLSHSWYSAVDFQLFLCGQLILFTLARSKRLGLLLLVGLLLGSPLITMLLTLRHHLPAVPLISSVNEQTMNLYYGEIYIKPYSRASPYLIGILLAYLMRTTRLAQCRLKRWQVALGWTLAISLLLAIILAMQPAMNGHTPSELASALYSGWSRPLWACATGWIIFACITKQAGPVDKLLGARCLVPLSKLTYPAFLIHPIIMASFYGTRQASFQFSHYLMLYLILGNIVITYASAFMLATLVELPFLSIERVISRRLFK